VPSNSRSEEPSSHLQEVLDNYQVSFFSDTISGLQRAIEGLSQLAGIEGLDAVASKLQEAAEICESMMIPIPQERHDG
jgi:hypothetical protein